MMFDTETRPRPDGERVLPLINVVFLLLIFFMLAGSLTANDPFPVDPPGSSSEAPAEQRETVILVGADGSLALDGRRLDPGALEAELSARADTGTLGPVWLKGDGAADALDILALLERLKSAGVDEITLLTVPESG